MGSKSVTKHQIDDVFYENGFKYVIIDWLKYTNGESRLAYTPDFHDNHKKYWSVEYKAYPVLIRVNMSKGYAYTSAALGRTYGTCAEYVS